MPEDVKWYVLWFYLDSWMGEPVVLGSNIGCEVRWSLAISVLGVPQGIKWNDPHDLDVQTKEAFSLMHTLVPDLLFYQDKKNHLLESKQWNQSLEFSSLWMQAFMMIMLLKLAILLPCSVSLLLATVNCMYSQKKMWIEQLSMLYCIEEEDALLEANKCGGRNN